MKRAYPLLTVALFACGRPAPSVPLPGAPGGERLGAQGAGPALVRARAPLAMPTCEAGELQGLTTLSEGVAAQSAIVRTARGPRVAFRTDADRDGNPELHLLALSDDGQPQGAAGVVATGVQPAHPVLLARGEGVLLAWREGPPGQERIVVREFDADGTPAARQPSAPAFDRGWLGAPAMVLAGDEVLLAVTRSAQRPADPEARAADTIEWASLGGSVRSARAPEGGAFEAERAPVLVSDGTNARLFVLTMQRGAVPGDERSLLEVPLAGTAPLRLVARDLSAPRARAVQGGTLLGWRARVSARDVAMRAYPLPASGDPPMPPLTVATFRGAFGAEVDFVPVSPGLLGAFTISTLADDAGGSLNVSVLTEAGEYVGRQPLLVSSRLRSARVSAIEHGDAAWFLLEARADDGSGPVLGVVPVACRPGQPVDRLNVPPPSLVQRLAEVDAAPLSLTTSADANACTAAGAPVLFARHHSGTQNALAGTSVAAVTLPRATALFAVTRAQSGERPALVIGMLDARGAIASTRTVLSGAGQVLAAGAAAGGALAVVSAGEGERERATVVALGANGAPRAPVTLPIVRPTSAALVPGTGTILVVGEREGTPGDVSLFAVPWQGGRAGTPVLVAALRPGDAVLDAARGTNETVALLARPDALGAEVTRALARVSIPDNAAAARRAAGLDPFADPLGYGRGEALLVPGERGPVVVFSEGAVVRAANLLGGELRDLRSILEVHPTGGALLGRSPGATETRWLAVSTGFPEDAAQRVSPITLAAVGPRGAVTTASAVIPDDAGALAEQAAVAADGGRVTLVYARAERDGTLAWMAARATCGATAAAGQGGRR